MPSRYRLLALVDHHGAKCTVSSDTRQTSGNRGFGKHDDSRQDSTREYNRQWSNTANLEV